MFVLLVQRSTRGTVTDSALQRVSAGPRAYRWGEEGPVPDQPNGMVSWGARATRLLGLTTWLLPTGERSRHRTETGLRVRTPKNIACQFDLALELLTYCCHSRVRWWR